MKKILVVDDEEDILYLVKRCLEKTKEYTVIATSLPEEVESLVYNENPDLILMDIVMPNMQGTELIPSLRENPKTAHIRIVVTSGLGEMVYHKKSDEWRWEPNRPVVEDRGEVIKERSAERAAEAYGVDDYIAKPFSPAILLQVVRNVIAKGPRQSEKDEE